MRKDKLLFQVMVSALHAVSGPTGPRSVQALAREHLRLHVQYDEALAAVSEPIPLYRLAGLLDDPALARQAYMLSARLVGESDSRARVFLDDFAEWLLLPPVDYRMLREQAAQLSSQAA